MASRFVSTALLSLWIAAALPLCSASTLPPRNVRYINGIPDTSSYFLDDTVTLARVNGRAIKALEFVETYYDSYGEDRPTSDSTGRVEWLNSMINKEILGTIARRANYSFGTEERLVMQQHTQRVLSNVLYKRAVLDSITVPEKEVFLRYDRLKTEAHLRHILVADPRVAERVRRDLDAKRITWKDAVAKYSIARNDSGPDGDLGWFHQAVDTDDVRIFGLMAGQISPVIEDPTGFQIVQLTARRAAEQPAWEGARDMIWAQLAKRQKRERGERLLASMRAHCGIQYDTTNVRWAAGRFSSEDSRDPAKVTVRLFAPMPVITAGDTGRVLARWPDGRLSLSTLLREYSDLPPLSRPDLSTPEGLRGYVDTIVLEPYKAQMAVERGLDRDPIAVALIEKKREQLLVEHMYQDSVEVGVHTSPAMRRKYYEAHLAQYMTYPNVRYALLVRPDSASAQALAERLRKGERAEAIQRTDSLTGVPSKLRAEMENGHGTYHALLFQELRPGMFEIQGPDRKGQYVVIQSLAFDPGRQLSFEESDQYVDNSLRAQIAEDMLKELISRHRREFQIESHPELVMRVKLMDPAVVETYPSYGSP